MFRSITIAVALLLPGTSVAQTVEQEAVEWALQDNQELVQELQLWGEMQFAANYVASRDSRCWVYLEMAEQSREELVALNQQYRGRADAEYRRQAEILQSDNRNAVEEYRSCFTSVVSGRFPIINAAGVAAYQAFIGRYNLLSDRFGEGDIQSLLQDAMAQRQALLAEQQGLRAEQEDLAAQIATVASVFSEVMLMRDGQLTPLAQGMVLRTGDEVITANDGRVRIEMNDRIDSRDAGPTVINVGPGSHVAMEDYQVRRDRAERTGLIQLIRGKLRAISRGFSGGQLSVRVSSTICGIRGTELVAEFDPDSGTSRYWLSEGDAYLETGNGIRRTLVPGEITEVQAERIVSQRRFDPAEYNALVRQELDTANNLVAQIMSRIEQDPNIPLTLAGLAASDQQLELPDSLAIGSLNSGVRRARQAAVAEVRQDLESVLGSYGNRDWELLFNYIPESNARQIQSDLRELGEAEVVRRNRSSFPADWLIDCVQCESGDDCEALLRISYENDPTLYRVTHYRFSPQTNARQKRWTVAESFGHTVEEYNELVANCSAP